MHVCMSQHLSHTCTHTGTASCFTACCNMMFMQYQSRKILMWLVGFFVLFCFFCLQYVAQTYGKEADTWFGSDLDPVIFAHFLFGSAWCTRWVRFTIQGDTMSSRELRQSQNFSATSNLPAPVLIVPIS